MPYAHLMILGYRPHYIIVYERYLVLSSWFDYRYLYYCIVYVLFSILMPLFFQNVVHTFSHPEQKEKIKEHYIKQLNIIRKGIEREKLC